MAGGGRFDAVSPLAFRRLGRNKEPWEYGDEFTAINRSTIELRYQFLPYIYTLFHEHEQTGMPVMRPLWFEYPADKQTYSIADEYLSVQTCSSLQS